MVNELIEIRLHVLHHCGAERVIVSQLVRSPSVYFNEKIDKNGRENYDATITILLMVVYVFYQYARIQHL
jgi:DNA-directed RNA polymerase beta subunit